MKELPAIKLYNYINDTFVLVAIIDDVESLEMQHSKYEAGSFIIQINYNVANSHLFEKNMFIQIGDDKRDFFVITKVVDEIGQDGKASQIRTISGYDCRYIYKRRVIKELNNGDKWTYSGDGEDCIRNLIASQTEGKRSLPINNIIGRAEGVGKRYSVSEAYSNLYDVCCTIATQTEIGWQVVFENNEMTLEFYYGVSRTSTVRFDTSFESLSNGKFEDTTESYTNAVYIGGNGSGSNKDIYEGENFDTSDYLLINEDGGRLEIGLNSYLIVKGKRPEGLNRFEAWDNASGLTSETQYINESISLLSQYGQTLSLSGNGLIKCPYVFREQYDIGDVVTVAFSGKTASVQILSITENWAWGSYELSFEFGKPIPDLSRQLAMMVNKIQTYQATAEEKSTSGIKYYVIPEETEQAESEVGLDVLGFTGNVGSGSTFKLYLNGKVGAKTYSIYIKQLAGAGKLTLTTGVVGKSDLLLDGGTYVTIIYVDTDGNVERII
ncbi:MAG: siphovirus ReqiPepy6 Gp37-like family protein [Treponema sp.]|nr:siphovirus ReqiPepy6 Gp37-like family protein [Treponema sp.]